MCLFSHVDVANWSVSNDSFRMASQASSNYDAFRSDGHAAFVLGYTGETGKALLKDLSRLQVFSKIVLVGRREVALDPSFGPEFVSLCVSMCLCHLCLSVCLSSCLFHSCLSVYLSVCLSVCLPLSLSFCVYVNFSMLSAVILLVDHYIWRIRKTRPVHLENMEVANREKILMKPFLR